MTTTEYLLLGTTAIFFLLYIAKWLECESKQDVIESLDKRHRNTSDFNE